MGLLAMLKPLCEETDRLENLLPPRPDARGVLNWGVKSALDAGVQPWWRRGGVCAGEARVHGWA